MFRFCLIFFLYWCYAGVYAQNYTSKNKSAIRYYNLALKELESQYQGKKNPKTNRYDEAMELLNKAVKKDPKFTEAHLALAQGYQIGGQGKFYKEMLFHFEQAIKSNPDSRKVIGAYYTLAGEKLKLGKYDEAKKLAQKFISFDNNTEDRYNYECNRIIACVDFAKEKIANPLNFKPVAMGKTINNPKRLQYSPALTADQSLLFFTVLGLPKEKHSEDIYVSTKTNGVWGEALPLPFPINTKENEGTCSISADGRTIVFANCQGRKNFGSCDLFISKLIGEQWTEPVNLGENVNSPYKDTQPSLSADGNTLYFISLRNKSSGSDIFVSYRSAEGYWSPAEMLPPPVNTEKDEYSPFIHANGKTLFFASNGHIGMGGTDLYSVERSKNQWSKPKNLGYPINNYLNQFAIFITADGKKGYYGDEKQEGVKEISSTIMEFDVPDAISVQIRTQYLKGRVLDAKTKKPLDAEIALVNLKNNDREGLMVSDKYSGAYLMILNEQTEYALETHKKGYAFKSMRFDYSTTKADDLKPLEIDILLSPIEQGTVFVLNNIFFDSGKADIRDKSKTELEELVRFMSDNPQVKGEISGHTDNVGDKKTNAELSLKRAKAIYDYLIKANIPANRLKYQGYGDLQPAAPNDTEENKQLNRRIEFKVL